MPTIALCIIVKNEERNLPRLLDSVKDCFDEIHVTDTGSTDRTIEIAKSYNCNVHHFDWVFDFAAARNYAFSHAKTDYILWLDADDTLEDAEGFKAFKNMLGHADMWFASYDYAHDSVGRPVCTFSRERIVKNNGNFEWKFFVHEGLAPINGFQPTVMYATQWRVKHHRSADDIEQDKGRNLNIFEKHSMQPMGGRMKFYWGKELFENKKPLEAYQKLMEASKAPDIELYDRLMAIQYAALAAMELKQFEEAISIIHAGIPLAPTRAEFFNLLGECYIAQNRFAEALPCYHAARNCMKQSIAAIAPPTHRHDDSYDIAPTMQLARIHFNMGDYDKAIAFATESQDIRPTPEALEIVDKANEFKAKLEIVPEARLKKTTDIVITGHPVGFYEWDKDILKTQGCGGSETAAIHMADALHRLTGRKVIIFNNRVSTKVIDGVEYRSAQTVKDYMNEFLPEVHVAWRHTTKLTVAKTYIWLHDLMAPGIENHQNYDYALCLSDFHRDYVNTLFGVPRDKVIVTRNGIDPNRFGEREVNKDRNKVVYVSSPDRGLEDALKVMDLVVQSLPEATLHVYYGFDNMYKNGVGHEADRLKQLCAERPYVKLVGNIDQNRLVAELDSASVWLYPTSFLETFCISAVETHLCRVWPVVRKWGALPDTMKHMPKDMLELDPKSNYSVYAARVIDAIEKEKWREINPTSEQFSWQSVAAEWVQLMDLK
jgi:tetratricopeptide (TPR) repeat protein